MHGSKRTSEKTASIHVWLVRFSLTSFKRLAISTPLSVSLLILRGAINSLSIKPFACSAFIISLHHCSVMPTCLAIWLFCSGPRSSNVIRIFCLTVRNILVHDKFAYLKMINSSETFKFKKPIAV